MKDTKETKKLRAVMEKIEDKMAALGDKSDSFEFTQSPEYKKLQLLKEQRAALPNNQAYTMGKYNVVGERPRWTPEQLAESKRRTDFENEMDWETNELAYAKFCELHSLETF